MFLRRKKEVPKGLPVPEHLGDLWHILQDIAKEEDSRFKEVSVAEHYNSSAEGMKDVKRWLTIYERRLDPKKERASPFPPDATRYRGHVLVRRNWPQGLRWDAFNEETLVRAPLPQAMDEETLKKAIDEHLGSGA
jgi:hypothetical protein